jgi:voltage-gated potassium channel
MMLTKYLKIYRKLAIAALAMIILIIIASFGYWFISGRETSFFNAFYMTIITLTTIGYGEIIDLSNNPAGRAFTIVIALSGIGILTYILTNITAIIVEGQLTDSIRRRRMEIKAQKQKGHYIVCGIGGIAVHIVRELYETKRPLVIVDISSDNMKKLSEEFPDAICIEGDATDNGVLLKAGIEKAIGIFATTDDDNENLVVGLCAKQLNPNIRVVARCNEIKNQEKLKRAGADAVISPTYIGGLRMASEMIRPTAVSFLDIMLRDTSKKLRVEEIPVPDKYTGKDIASLNLKRFQDVLLLAIRSEGKWKYNPPEDHTIKSNDTLILMTSPEERLTLEDIWK